MRGEVDVVRAEEHDAIEIMTTVRTGIRSAARRLLRALGIIRGTVATPCKAVMKISGYFTGSRAVMRQW
jgi:hypothetical protein